MEEPDTQYGPVKRGWYGDREQTAMATETESGSELRRRMSETLVPGAWAEASGCWCQNSVLRGCGQTKIKGAGATEWHHTHMHAYTRLNGLSQIGFIMSQPLGLSNPPPFQSIMQCD